MKGKSAVTWLLSSLRQVYCRTFNLPSDRPKYLILIRFD